MLISKIQSFQHELDALVVQLERDLDVLSASAWEFSERSRESPSWTRFDNQLDVLEIYCGENSRITSLAQQMGLKATRFTKSDGDLQTVVGRNALWQVL